MNCKALVIMESMTRIKSFVKYADLFYDEKVLEDLLEDTSQAQVDLVAKSFKGLGVEGYDNVHDEVGKQKKVVGRAPMPFEAVEPNLLDMEYMQPHKLHKRLSGGFVAGLLMKIALGGNRSFCTIRKVWIRLF